MFAIGCKFATQYLAFKLDLVTVTNLVNMFGYGAHLIGKIPQSCSGIIGRTNKQRSIRRKRTTKNLKSKDKKIYVYLLGLCDLSNSFRAVMKLFPIREYYRRSIQPIESHQVNIHNYRCSLR